MFNSEEKDVKINLRNSFRNIVTFSRLQFMKLINVASEQLV